MSRRAKPCYHKGLKRWYAKIGEAGTDGRARAVYAPVEIQDETEAWAWFTNGCEMGKPGGMTVEQVCENYLYWAEKRRDDGRMDAGHYSSKVQHLKILCEDAGKLRKRAARTLTAEDANRLLVRLEKACYSVHYRANIVKTVDACFKWAVVAGHLEANPIRGHDRVTVPRAAARFAEPAEAAGFLRFWLHRLPRGTAGARHDRSALLLVRCLVRTGARPKELCRLRWDQINWEGARSSSGGLFAVATLTRHKTSRTTGKPRTIYFPPGIRRTLLRAYNAPGRHPEFVFVHGPGPAKERSDKPWKDGSEFSKKIRKIRVAALAEMERRAAAGEPMRGLDMICGSGLNRTHCYKFRHTAISTLLRQGVNVPTIAELMGTSPAMIYHTYGHLLGEDLARAAERL